MRSKTYRAVKEKTSAEAIDLNAAIAFIKEHARSTFDETVELHIHLSIDQAKSDQMVRGTVSLPAGLVKQQSIVVFTEDTDAQTAATAAGATRAGGEELIADIEQAGKLDADITIATPSMMPKIAKVAKVLGPKGLMPNPKTGTVTDDPAGVVKELLGGKLSFKMDQLGNIHQALAKVSWDADKIASNVLSFIQAVKDARPASAKGELILSATLKSTMSPAIRISV